MNAVKKLILAPFFLIILAILISQLNPLLKSYEFIFSLSLDTFIQLIVLSGLILLSSFSFVLFASFAFDWKIVLPVSLVSSILPMLFVNQTLGLILSVGILVSLLITYLEVEKTLKNYLTFDPNSLFGPPIRHLSSMLILVISLTYFLSISQVIQQKSFQIPDSLIETSLKLVPQSQSEKTETTQQPLPTISPQQIELLKKNPDLLKQYGLDPKILDSLTQPKKAQTSKPPQDLLTGTVKQAIKDQLQNVLKPYLGIIPAVLDILLFLILQSLLSILNLLIYPFLWITFYILEKSGFIKFTVETRSVKKMVI